MICPVCKKELPDDALTCPRCSADLALSIGQREYIREKLTQARAKVTAGDLDGAVWAYLEVLHAEPFEPTAREQVGRVAAAVRHFDRMAYLKYGGPGPRGASGVAVLAGVALGLLVTGFVAGAWYGRMTAPAPPPAGTTPAEPEALPPPAPAEE